MTRARSLLVLATGWACHVLQAQCGLVLTSGSAQEDCSNYAAPYAQASWSGGTPPFTVSFLTNSGAATQALTSVQDWSGTLTADMFDTQATVTVTDAMGCTDNATVGWMNHVPFQPEFSLTLSCTLGGTLRWTGMNFTGWTSPQATYCPGPFTYCLHNLTTGTTWNGAVSSDWVQESPSSWRFNQGLPGGDYAVDIFPTNVSPGPSCNTGIQIDCYFPSYFTVPISPGDCGINFQLRAALSGALPGGTFMSDQLRTSGLIPATEPYSALGYAYVGAAPGASLVPALLTATGNNAIVDWVVVELRSAGNAGTVLHSRPALIQRDGDVVGLNGAAYINAPLAAGNYYVALRHRNHLGIMTASARALALDPTAAIVDLRLSSTATYGTAARVAVGTVQCLWPGDATGNGTIKYTGAGNDRDPIILAVGGSTPNNTVPNVYDRRDTNLDGVIKYTGAANDRDIILTNVGSTTPNNTRTQQLP